MAITDKISALEEKIKILEEFKEQVNAIPRDSVNTNNVQVLSRKVLKVPLIDDFSRALHDHSVASAGGSSFATSASDSDKLDGLDSTAYALLSGRAGGQTLYGGTGSGENLALHSTSHATKGSILLESNFIYTEATAYKQLDLGNGGLINTGISDYSKILFHTDLSADHNEWGFSSLVDMLDYTETGPAEKAALVGMIRNKVGSTAPNLVDGVGVLGQGYIVNTTTGRAWGLVGEAFIPDAADDGLLIGAELGICNKGTTPTTPNGGIDSTLAKINLWLTAQKSAGYNKANAAIAFAGEGSSGWDYGIFMRWVEKQFIRMNNPGASGACGIDMPNDANWGAAMRIPNQAPIYIYNGAGSPVNMLYLSSGDVLVIGNDLGDGKLQLNVDGATRFVSCGPADSGGAGYRYLRVPNA